MNKNRFIAILLRAGILFLVAGCLEPYNPPAIRSNANYLVVEGFLNWSGPSTIQLSRTVELSDSDNVVHEMFATVQIEREDGIFYSLSETSPGSYYSPGFLPDISQNVRLSIKTLDNKEYVSDFVAIKETPDIDTVKWVVEESNLTIYVDAHDDNNDTHYYLWKYAETWKYTAKYQSDYKYENDQIVPRDPTDDIFHCWKTLQSNQVHISSSLKLERDIISNYPLITMKRISEKLQSRYSVLVEQYALTQGAFLYWQLVKKNTQNLGSIFDPLPSQTISNIHCITNPQEPVVGYFSACSIRQTRIFIDREDLPLLIHATGYESCELHSLLVNAIPYFRGQELIVNKAFKGITFLGYTLASPFCADCRVRNGTTVKPDFW